MEKNIFYTLSHISYIYIYFIFFHVGSDDWGEASVSRNHVTVHSPYANHIGNRVIDFGVGTHGDPSRRSGVRPIKGKSIPDYRPSWCEGCTLQTLSQNPTET